MSEYWRLENGVYSFYTQNKDIMHKIKRSYSNRIRFMCDYVKNGHIIAKQYHFTKAELRRVRSFIANEQQASKNVN